MTQEQIKALAEKYQRYVSNIQWHIKTNEPTGAALEACQTKMTAYQEILHDFSLLELKPPASEPEKWEDMNEEFKALYPIPLEDFGKDFVGTLQILSGYQETSDNYIKLRMVANTIKKIIDSVPASESREAQPAKPDEGADNGKEAKEFSEWLELQGYRIKGMDDGQRDKIYNLFKTKP